MTHRVLIIEDDDDHAELLSLGLSRIDHAEFAMTRARTVNEALDVLDETPVDVVFADYRLETETSERFLNEVHTRFSEVPVIVTTCQGDEYVAARLSRAGAVAYLRKSDLSTESLELALREAWKHLESSRNRGRLQREARDRLERLTPREREVLGLILEGLLTKEIAASLGCAEGTVKIHRARIMEKMGATTPAELARFTIRAQGDDAAFGDADQSPDLGPSHSLRSR